MAPNTRPVFASVVLDVDSTLCGIEGIDFLGSRRGPTVGAAVASLTDRAMRGDISLESVYGERLTIIQPTRADIAALSEGYQQSVAPGAPEVLAELRRAGVHVVLVSGGIKQAIEPIARALGVDAADLHAVSVSFDAAGHYLSFDSHSPLTTQHGKAAIVEKLLAECHLRRPVLAVGDGSTDVVMAAVADVFAAYTGFARRLNVVKQAAFEVRSFAELLDTVRGPKTGDWSQRE